MKYLLPVRPKWVVKLISAQNMLKFDIDIANIIMKYSLIVRPQIKYAQNLLKFRPSNISSLYFNIKNNFYQKLTTS